MQLFSVNEEFLVSTISSECADYVPVLCTHRPSLLPIECFSEIFGLVFRVIFGSFGLIEKMFKLDHLEEVKVVTRYS